MRAAGSFVIPTEGEKSANVWYRIHLKVTDSGGLTHESFRDVLPRTTRSHPSNRPRGPAGFARRRANGRAYFFRRRSGDQARIATVRSQSLERHDLRVSELVGRRHNRTRHRNARHRHDARCRLCAKPENAPGVVQFSASAYQASEADGHVDVTVTRSGDTSAARVEYATTTAQPRSVPTICPRSARSVSRSGETSKVIRVLLTGGAVVEATGDFQHQPTRVSARPSRSARPTSHNHDR